MNKKHFITYLFAAFIAASLSSCIRSVSKQTDKNDNTPKLMWFDATANYARFSDPDSIDYYLEKIKSLGFTDAVIDIRPISGYVLYKSDLAPFLKEHKGFKRDENFDFLAHFIDKAHHLGLRVQASLNTFVAGHNYVDKGIIYEEGKQHWASVIHTPDKGLIPITEEKQKYSAMVNPIDPEFRTYILNIFKEVVVKYPQLDGIMLDRVRYDGFMADFSDLSRREFEKYIGKKLEKFPDDIYRWEKNSEGKIHPQRGEYFLPWMEWRTKNIHDFMQSTRNELRKINPNLSFGTYTGAWYPSYYEVGVNFASNGYDPSQEFDWATPTYKNSGYAELIDMFTVGNYYTNITKEQYLHSDEAIKNETDMQAQKNIWYCVEGSNENLRRIMGKNKFIGGILVDQFYDDPDGLTESIKMNLATSDGVMIFDIVHIIDKNMWDFVERGMREGGAIK